MGGYVPLFASIATGTLYGRWPDIGLWPIVLALSDRYGRLDVTPQYIAGVTGLPVSEVIECMKRFCAPDPYSRTKDENGSRLKLIDDHRDWGWIVVNHAKYAEKARLRNKDEQRKINSPVSPGFPRSSPVCPESTLSSSTSTSTSTSTSEKIKKQDMSGSPTVRPNGHSHPALTPEPVMKVFEHWRVVHKHPKAVLDNKRRKVITAALDLYPPETLCRAIDGYRKSDFHMGKNERKTVYDDIGLMLRDAKQIDAGITFAERIVWE